MVVQMNLRELHPRQTSKAETSQYQPVRWWARLGLNQRPLRCQQSTRQGKAGTSGKWALLTDLLRLVFPFRAPAEVHLNHRELCTPEGDPGPRARTPLKSLTKPAPEIVRGQIEDTET